jgi:hypothetical protein
MFPDLIGTRMGWKLVLNFPIHSIPPRVQTPLFHFPLGSGSSTFGTRTRWQEIKQWVSWDSPLLFQFQRCTDTFFLLHLSLRGWEKHWNESWAQCLGVTSPWTGFSTTSVWGDLSCEHFLSYMSGRFFSSKSGVCFYHILLNLASPQDMNI